MSSLQVGMRRYACVDPHWLCVDKWIVSYSDMHIAYCLLPVLLRMDALGYHSMGLGRFPQSGPIPGVWIDSMGLGGFPVYGPISLGGFLVYMHGSYRSRPHLKNQSHALV